MCQSVLSPETQLILSRVSILLDHPVYTLSLPLSRDHSQIPVVFVHPASHSPPPHYYCSEWVRRRGKGDHKSKEGSAKQKSRNIPRSSATLWGTPWQMLCRRSSQLISHRRQTIRNFAFSDGGMIAAHSATLPSWHLQQLLQVRCNSVGINKRGNRISCQKFCILTNSFD